MSSRRVDSEPVSGLADEIGSIIRRILSYRKLELKDLIALGGKS